MKDSKNLSTIKARVVKRLMKDRVAIIGAIVLVLFYVFILFADFLAPYAEDFSDRSLSYAPPTSIYIMDENGNLSWPYIYRYQRAFDPIKLKYDYSEDRSKKYYVQFFTTQESFMAWGLFPCEMKMFSVEEPARLYIIGADFNGRDTFSRLFWGGRVSLTIGFLALFISLPIGAIYGGISGYLGGVVDTVLMRVAEAIMSIPSFYLLIALIPIIPENFTGGQRFALITAILAFIGWAGFSRIIRGMVLSIKEYEFVEAAKSLGASFLRIITMHILPQTASFVIVAITLSVPGYILAESGLSFLGFGIQQPDASWGNMLKEAQDYTNILKRPWLLAPGFLIFFAILSFNVIGDAIRDALDPKSQIRL